MVMKFTTNCTTIDHFGRKSMLSGKEAREASLWRVAIWLRRFACCFARLLFCLFSALVSDGLK